MIDNSETLAIPVPISQPQVAVLMTAFNAAPFIGQAIESIPAQTFRDFELVIADDASTDATVRIAAEYDDPHIRLVQRTSSGDPARAANTGLATTASSYTARLCDRMTPLCHPCRQYRPPIRLTRRRTVQRVAAPPRPWRV